MQIQKRISAEEAERLLAEGQMIAVFEGIAHGTLNNNVQQDFICLNAQVNQTRRYHNLNLISDQERNQSLEGVQRELESLLPRMSLDERRSEAERALCAGFEHWANDDLQGAMASFEHAGHLFPNDAEVAINQGVIHARMQEVDKAFACFDRAVSARPDAIFARINKGSLLKMNGDTAAAQQEWAIALSMLPPDDPYFSVLKDLLDHG
jgi:tetratricopeptide (TPR) repeat protein